jgi:multidrug efflux system outer membrane protein
MKQATRQIGNRGMPVPGSGEVSATRVAPMPTPTLFLLAACAALGAALGAGCAATVGGLPERSVVELPGAWSVSSGAPGPAAGALVHWWARFSDPMLERLEAQAMTANTSVLGARAALRQARALRDVDAAALLPTLGGSASAQRGSSNPSGIPGRRITSNSFQAGVDAGWELDLFGANRNALAASEATAQASAASLGDVQVSVTAELALAYIALRNSQARLAIASENLASQQESLQITQWRQQAGLGTVLDVEQARAAAEQTAALVPALQKGIDQQSHAIAVLVGEPPSSLQAQLAAATPVPLAGDDLALSLPAQTLRQRADVRAAEQQVLAAQARVRQSEAARMPDFSIRGSLGLSALALGTLTNGTSVVGSMLGSVTLPLFDAGAARARVDAQRGARDQAVQVYRATVLVALRDVEDALVALRDDRLRLARLRAAAGAAAVASSLAQTQYQSGLVDFQVVLQTQRTLLGTQDGLASAGADVSSDHVILYKALGGGWTPEPRDPAAGAAHRLGDAGP